MKTLIKKGNYITTFLENNQVVTDYIVSKPFNQPIDESRNNKSN